MAAQSKMLNEMIEFINKHGGDDFKQRLSKLGGLGKNAKSDTVKRYTSNVENIYNDLKHTTEINAEAMNRTASQRTSELKAMVEDVKYQPPDMKTHTLNQQKYDEVFEALPEGYHGPDDPDFYLRRPKTRWGNGVSVEEGQIKDAAYAEYKAKKQANDPRYRNEITPMKGESAEDFKKRRSETRRQERKEFLKKYDNMSDKELDEYVNSLSKEEQDAFYSKYADYGHNDFKDNRHVKQVKQEKKAELAERKRIKRELKESEAQTQQWQQNQREEELRMERRSLPTKVIDWFKGEGHVSSSFGGRNRRRRELEEIRNMGIDFEAAYITTGQGNYGNYKNTEKFYFDNRTMIRKQLGLDPDIPKKGLLSGLGHDGIEDWIKTHQTQVAIGIATAGVGGGLLLGSRDDRGY